MSQSLLMISGLTLLSSFCDRVDGLARKIYKLDTKSNEKWESTGYTAPSQIHSELDYSRTHSTASGMAA
jgi:hypothetical protein